MAPTRFISTRKHSSKRIGNQILGTWKSCFFLKGGKPGMDWDYNYHHPLGWFSLHASSCILKRWVESWCSNACTFFLTPPSNLIGMEAAYIVQSIGCLKVGRLSPWQGNSSHVESGAFTKKGSYCSLREILFVIMLSLLRSSKVDLGLPTAVTKVRIQFLVSTRTFLDDR